MAAASSSGARLAQRRARPGAPAPAPCRARPCTARSVATRVVRNFPAGGGPWDPRRVPSTADLVCRTLPIAMLSLSLIAVPVLVLEPQGLPRLRGLQKELDDVNAENEELRRDVARLRVQ